ncbi:MAG: L-threonine 3-dehydrogenase [Gemmatimonadota bacterium]|nr:L-threonine 3-dehydrogenase [Gemmatimonadota bacterium]MDH3367113.1 L-threonine 3-dehydrogenase [Gemmatimonadota bacterium]MDH3476715.1 L-threonine 3-dehydrogenase [Gemmatimonadota bacterium]MDH5549635.1 L-threonine 3-dehydrogenase [Gemmatimonadota bacterium]
MQRILVTGALGQVGSELVPALRTRYGTDHVIASDIRVAQRGAGDEGPFQLVDCTSQRQIQEAVRRYQIDTIYHLAALLSAVAEQKPQVAWDINMGGLYRTLEVARENRCAVFVPSSIGAFGPNTPTDGTPQDTIQRPTSMYGITKVAGELLCDYYHGRFGVDARGVRYPGIISHVTPPGGGTTDYAVEIFHDAVRHGRYTCFLRPDTRLDMMYMPDAVKAAIELMEADPERLRHRNAFNVTAMNFTPEELAAAIRRHMPGFTIDYGVDPVRQAIADSWPNSIDDSAARAEWGWAPSYDLLSMTADMLSHVSGGMTLTD